MYFIQNYVTKDAKKVMVITHFHPCLKLQKAIPKSKIF